MLSRFRDPEFLQEFAQFAAGLLIAALLLNILLSVRPEMPFERRIVAQHTGLFLSILGIKSDFYDNSVTIPDSNPEQEGISEKLLNLGFDYTRSGNSTQMLSARLHPDNQKIVDAYVSSLMAEGLPVYYSPAVLKLSNGRALVVDIIPECVGWIGFFAVAALILSYPRKTLKSKLFGVAIAFPLMYLMNIARVGTTIAAWYWGGAGALGFVHDLLWKTVLIFWALALWLFWVKYISVPEKRVKYTSAIGIIPWKRSRRTRKPSRKR